METNTGWYSSCSCKRTNFFILFAGQKLWRKLK